MIIESYPFYKQLCRYIYRHHDHVFSLVSSLQTTYSGRYSYLGIDCSHYQTVENWEDLDKITAQNTGQSLTDRTWIVLPYEFGNGATAIVCTCQTVLVWDHETETLTTESKTGFSVPDLPLDETMDDALRITGIRSNMTKDMYLSHVKQCLHEIHEGTYYQLNLTRKFWIDCDTISSNQIVELFTRLCSESPAPYASFIKCPGYHILSSSPELFLQRKDQTWTARPIKGTLNKGDLNRTACDDEKTLSTSSKDQAENLMIVDLMRHDLSQFCKVGTVKVPALYDLDSFQTLHHLSSTITGTHDPSHSIVSGIQHAFPPGSMTGTPKAKAVEYANHYEKDPRGIYSGAIGWISKDACDLSVVIRTMVIKNSCIEFQVGGAITAQSNPESEWHETLVKAKGICFALGLDPFTDLTF